MLEDRFLELQVQYSPATLDTTRKHFNSVYNYHYKRFLTDERQPLFPINPTETLEIAKWFRRTGSIKVKELAKFWDATENLDGVVNMYGYPKRVYPDIAADFFQFMLLNGLRLGEMLKLRYENFNPVSECLVVKDTKNGQDLNIPLAKYSLAIVKRRIAAKDRLSRIFPVGDIKPYNFKLKEVFENSVTNHDLRRSFASYATACGVSPFYLKLYMNHSASSTGHDDVTGGYIQPDEEALRDGLQQIENFVLEKVK